MNFIEREKRHTEQQEINMTCIGGLAEDIAALVRNGVYDIDRIGVLVGELNNHYGAASLDEYLYNRAIHLMIEGGD